MAARRLARLAIPSGVFVAGAHQASMEDRPTRLVAVHAIFRHGARTPVYTSSPEVSAVEWPGCSACCERAFSLELPKAEPVLLIGGASVRPCPVHMHHLLDKSLPPPRAPAEILDQWNAPLKGGCRAGQLTDLGCEQAYVLGKRLREEYAERLIGDKWDASVMTARSTCVPRCVASAQLVLAGLFPAQTEPVPLAIGDFSEETLFPNGRLSERLTHILAAGRESWQSRPSDEAMRVREILRAKMPEASFAAFGMEKCNFVRLRDVLVALSTHGLPLPHGLEADGLPDRIGALATEQIIRMMRGGGGEGGTGPDHSHEAHRHSLGIFMAQVLAEMAASVRGQSDVSLRLFSAHDTTLLPLLMILGAFEPPHDLWPGFSSCIALELHDLAPAARRGSVLPRQESEFGVRVLFNFEDITQRVPGCPESGPCPLPAFRKAVSHSLPGADGDTGADPHGGSHDPVLVGGGMSQF